MYSEKFVVNKDEVDAFEEIKISSLMRNVQNVAGNHAIKLHIDRDVLMKDNNIWVVVRYDIDVTRLPKLKEKYIISTHPGETKGFMFPRYFQIFDKHNNLLVNISSTWVVINFESRRIILRPFKDVSIEAESSPLDLDLPTKINEPAYTLVGIRNTLENELDINIHINNTYYFDYVLDIHNQEFYKENKLKRLSLNYEKEITHPSKIEIFSSKSNPEVVIGKVDENVSFISKVEFIKR